MCFSLQEVEGFSLSQFARVCDVNSKDHVDGRRAPVFELLNSDSRAFDVRTLHGSLCFQQEACFVFVVNVDVRFQRVFARLTKLQEEIAADRVRTAAAKLPRDQRRPAPRPKFFLISVTRTNYVYLYTQAIIR